ncbi:MAG: DUF927 domain-containing protein [bacterium]
MRVDSGTGIQAYWLFEEDIAIHEWRIYAELFRDYCIKNNLKIDSAITADAARLMRCPDTLNYKTDPPNITRVLDSEYPQYDFCEFKEFLNEWSGVVPEQDHKSVLDGIQKGFISEIDIQPTRLRSSFEVIAQKSVDEEGGCNQIKNIIESTRVDYNSWISILSIAVNCIEGFEAVHELSKYDPRYNAAQTQSKAEEFVGNPFKCSTFEKYRPNGCDGCPYHGKITNPLALGQVVEEVRPEENAVRVKAKEDIEFPDCLKPYSRHRDGGIYYIPPPAKDKEGKFHQDPPVRLTAHDVYPVTRMYSKGDGGSLLMRHVLPKDPFREFTLNLSTVVSMDDFKKVLARNDIMVPIPLVPRMYDYICKWVEYYQRQEVAENMRMQMGWTEDYESFVLGNFEISRKGERVASTSPMIKNSAKYVRRAGDYETWQKSANMLDLPGFETQALGLLMGFGSPLMRLTSTAGCAINFLNSDTGAGKTAALYSGLSVFSDPHKSSLIEGSSTANAMIGRYLGMKNIMFGLDEIGNFDAKELSRLLHMISQGKAKARMQSSVNAERELEMEASLLLGSTSNQSLYDKFFSIKARPDGEIARMIELVVKRPPLMHEDSFKYGNQIFDPFRTNYGWAGPKFIEHYYKVGEPYVRNIMNRRTELFYKDYSKDPAYRFYANAIVCCFTGGELAIEAGIINIDIDRVYNKIILDMIQIRDKTVKLNTTDYKGLLTEFMYSQFPNFLILDENRVVSEPRNSLVGRIEVHNQEVYISKQEFKKFLATKQISMREFELPMEKEGVLDRSEKKRMSAGWRAGMGATPPMNCLVFKTQIPSDLINLDA